MAPFDQILISVTYDASGNKQRGKKIILSAEPVKCRIHAAKIAEHAEPSWEGALLKSQSKFL